MIILTLFLMEKHLQDGFQFVNGGLFERLILLKWLTIYLSLKHIILLHFFLFLSPIPRPFML